MLVQTDELVVWDLETKGLVAKIPDLHCQQIALLKQDGWLLCVEHSVTIYDWKNRSSVATIPPESQQPYSLLAYSNKTDRMILRHGNGAVSVWQLGRSRCRSDILRWTRGRTFCRLPPRPIRSYWRLRKGHTIHLHDLSGTTIRDVTIEGGKPRNLLAPDHSRLAASVGKFHEAQQYVTER